MLQYFKMACVNAILRSLAKDFAADMIRVLILQDFDKAIIFEFTGQTNLDNVCGKLFKDPATGDLYLDDHQLFAAYRVAKSTIDQHVIHEFNGILNQYTQFMRAANIPFAFVWDRKSLQICRRS